MIEPRLGAHANSLRAFEMYAPVSTVSYKGKTRDFVSKFNKTSGFPVSSLFLVFLFYLFG